MANHLTTHGSLQTAIHESADVVSNYQHYVHYIGTSEDTPMFREKLHKAKQHVGALLKDISAEKEHEIHDHIKDKNNVVDTKIIEEFGAVVREYRETEGLKLKRKHRMFLLLPNKQIFRLQGGHVAIGRYLPLSYPSVIVSLHRHLSYCMQLESKKEKNDEAGRNADQDADLRESLDELKRMEALLLKNEDALKEILRDGEGNEEEVRRVQGEINSLKALINDLKSLEIEEVDAANIPRTLTAQPQVCDKKSNSTILDCFRQIFGSCFLWE